eukprot:scaffold5514_cov166-Ochromonas_danica.AAC.14
MTIVPGQHSVLWPFPAGEGGCGGVSSPLLWVVEAIQGTFSSENWISLLYGLPAQANNNETEKDEP